ncbi:MAG: Rv1733c family protein [Streptosporangiaceae bacterium]
MNRRTGRWRGRIRLWWPDRNPLRRTCDRIQAVITAALIAVFLAGVPFVAGAAGRWERAAAVRAEHAQMASRHRVSAVLEAGTPKATQSGYYRLGTSWGNEWPRARARWVTPDGTPHSGLVPVPPDARAGTSVAVWVGPSGQLADPPLTSADVALRGRIAVVLGPVVLGLLLLCAGALAGFALNRKRLSDWQADWRITAPRWSRQQH